MQEAEGYAAQVASSHGLRRHATSCFPAGQLFVGGDSAINENFSVSCPDLILNRSFQ